MINGIWGRPHARWPTRWVARWQPSSQPNRRWWARHGGIAPRWRQLSRERRLRLCRWGRWMRAWPWTRHCGGAWWGVGGGPKGRRRGCRWGPLSRPEIRNCMFSIKHASLASYLNLDCFRSPEICIANSRLGFHRDFNCNIKISHVFGTLAHLTLD